MISLSIAVRSGINCSFLHINRVGHLYGYFTWYPTLYPLSLVLRACVCLGNRRIDEEVGSPDKVHSSILGCSLIL